MKFDIFAFLGEASCDAVSNVTIPLGQGAACSSDQFWDAGLVTVGLALVLALAVYQGGRERRRRDNYLL